MSKKSKMPSYKLVKYGNDENEVVWRGSTPITRIRTRTKFGPGKYALFMHGYGVKGIKKYDEYTIGSEIMPEENYVHFEAPGPTLSEMSNKELFNALDNVLDSEAEPHQLYHAKQKIKSIVQTLKARGTTEKEWENYAADKGGNKLLYMLGGIVAGGVIGALAIAYFYNGKLKSLEDALAQLKNELYQTKQAMNAPRNNIDQWMLSQFNKGNPGKP